MGYSYSIKIREGMARAVAISLPISTKQSVEICNFIRGKNIDDVREMLKGIIEKKIAVPYKRFTNGAGHKKGIASGKYPQKACKEVLKVIDMAEANAQHKGLSSNLRIKTVLAQKASTPWHFGRKRRRKMKRTHIEIILEEAKKDENASKMPVKKEAKGTKKMERKIEKEKKKREEPQEEIKKEIIGVEVKK